MQGAPVAAGWMFGAKRVAGAEAHRFQRLGDVPLQHVRPAQTDQPAQRAFAIRRGGVDEQAGHRAALLFRRPGVDALADTGGGVTAFQSQLAHQRVGKAVNEDVTHSGETIFRRFNKTHGAPFFVGVYKLCGALVYGRFPHPGRNTFFVELDKNPLAAYLGGRRPFRRLAGQRGRFNEYAQIRVGQFAHSVQASKAHHRPHFPQTFDENHLVYELPVPGWRRDRP